MTYSPVIKICGIKTPELLETVIAAGAEMVGFMHFPKSPRHADLDTIAELISLARTRIETVVITVNPDNSIIAELAAFDPDWVQLHGTESTDRVADIRAEGGLTVIKALPMGSIEDAATVEKYAEVADRIILDAKPPKLSERPGGLGVPFDWTILDALDPGLEFMLSGGLTPDNVAEAVNKVRPFGLDVSSGVESAPGVKDPARIAAFIKNARAVAAAIKD